VAAHCELEEDFAIDDCADSGAWDLLASPMYWQLRQTFVEAGSDGSGYAFLEAIWRAYNAGRLSPNRLTPDSEEMRSERSMRRHLARYAAKT
jgi:hypothetical protein